MIDFRMKDASISDHVSLEGALTKITYLNMLS